MHFQLTVFYVNNVNTTGRGKRQENPLKRANFAGNSWVKLVPRPPPTSLLEHSQFLGISDPLIATAFLTPMIFLDPLHLLTLQNKTFFLRSWSLQKSISEICFWNWSSSFSPLGQPWTLGQTGTQWLHAPSHPGEPAATLFFSRWNVCIISLIC